MERKIGEIFQFGGEWYQCVNGECKDCDFSKDLFYCKYLIGRDFCKAKNIFKKLEKVGEPYLAHDHSRNKDVIVQDYKLHSQSACYNGHEEMLSFGLCGRNGIVTIKSKEPIKSLNCENSVEIQIKQNKEDMEERKLNIKPFDLQKAREGKPVCTRDGAKARIICFDAKSDAPIIALITADDGTEITFDYLSDGTFFNSENPDNDLMMLPEKKEGWINIYKGNKLDSDYLYPTKKDAINNIFLPMKARYIDTIKVTWKE